MTFPPPVSVIKRVKYLSIRVCTRDDGRGYTDADKCSFVQVNGLVPLADTGTRTRVHGQV